MVRRPLVGLLLCTLLLGASRVFARGGGGHGGHGGHGVHGPSSCGHFHHAHVVAGGYGSEFFTFAIPTPILHLDVPAPSSPADEPVDAAEASAQHRYDYRINDD
jgi:hypothetical protein